MMLPRQTVESQRLLDVGFYPVTQLLVPLAPFLQPSGQILSRLFDRSAIIDPSQLCHALAVSLSRQVVKGVTKEMHIAALPGSFRQHLANRCTQARMIVADNKLHPVEAALLECQQERFPTADRFSIG